MSLKFVDMDNKEEYTSYRKKKKHEKFVKDNPNASKTEPLYENNEDLKDFDKELPGTPELKGKVVKIDKLRVRNYPEGDVITLINRGVEVTIVSDFDDIWYKVKLENGTVGYCMKEYLETFIEGEVYGSNDTRRCKPWPKTL